MEKKNNIGRGEFLARLGAGSALAAAALGLMLLDELLLIINL
jgi:hypothetical protein